jgi:hypothetical protein
MPTGNHCDIPGFGGFDLVFNLGMGGETERVTDNTIFSYADRPPG